MSALNTFYTTITRELSWLKDSFWNWGMISVLPLLFGLVLWSIFSLQTAHNLPIGVLDLDNTLITRKLTRYLDASPGLQVKEIYTNTIQAEQALKNASVYAFVLIPKDTTNHIKTQKKANIVLHHNAQFGTHSPLMQKDVRTVVGTVSAGIEINVKNKKGETVKVAKDTFNPLQSILVPLFNQAPDYQIYLATSLIPTILHIIAMMTGAFIFGRELRDKTMREWLIGINLRKINYSTLTSLILGKIVPSILSLATVGLLFMLLFCWVTESSVLTFLYTYTSLVLLLTLSIILGGCFSMLVLSLRKGLTMSSFFTAPAFAFVGVGFPIAAMPHSAQVWAKILPLTHYLKIQVNLLQIGVSYARCIPTILGFIFFIALFLILLHITTLKAFTKPNRWGAR